MASTKATGIDGLSVKLLKLTFNHVGGILHFIFNQSISSGTFVDAWKRARVVPLYKAGDENLVNNYRPVSILPIVSKIIERHVFNSFYEYLSTNKLVTDSQSGFRPSHSCETALNGLTDIWFKNMDDGKLTGVLFIDLRKAFDTVNHTVLLHKLLSYGICHNTFKWFQSYLSNRKQYVRWRGALSKETDVSIGVPQGSILGPLFFILYINDSPECLKHYSVTMYADDTSQAINRLM